MDRRTFIINNTKSTIGLSTAMLLGNTKNVIGANDKINVALVGCGGRGSMLLKTYARDERFRFTYICDPDERRGVREFEMMKEEHNPNIKKLVDFRPMLDDQSVDLVMICTPDHWHALSTILACQAGKDVYVEKPMSHNLWEGRKMIEAARKYNRVVQVGMQSRSAPYLLEAADYIREGNIGKIQLCKVFNLKADRPFKTDKTYQPPKEVHLDLWLGAASEDLAFAYDKKGWLYYWDFCNGDMMNDCVHQTDIARWLIDERYPNQVHCYGGHYGFDDDREVPDTQFATLNFDDKIVTVENGQNMQYMKKSSMDLRNRSEFPDWRFNATRIEIYGSDGFMIVGRHGSGWQAFNPDGEVVAEAHGRFPDEPHKENLYECLQSRNKPTADVEQGHLSCLWIHLANISYKLGGKNLSFDQNTETCHDPEADKLLKRHYREPYTVPVQV